jgi:4-azaleucine resistance transporter AzlC
MKHPGEAIGDESREGRRPDGEGVRTGLVRSTPIVLGYLPVSFAFGVMAQKAGLDLWAGILMSLVVYAGASQFIAVGLILAGSTPVGVVAAVFLVNLRHAVMSSSLAPYLTRWSRLELALFCFQLTDETYAIHVSQIESRPGGRASMLALNAAAHAAWVTGTVLGVLAGGLIVDVRPYGLDYALPSLFIALLLFQVKDRPKLLAGVVAGGLATALTLAGWERGAVIAATLVGATFGFWVSRWMTVKSSS